MRLPSKSAAFGAVLCLLAALLRIAEGRDYGLAIVFLIIAIGTLVADYWERREK